MKRLFSLILLSYLAVHTFAQSRVQEKLPKGTTVSILEIDKEDTYYDERTDFLGQEATALGELTKNSNGFYSGTLELNSGRTCFFRYVKVATISSPKATTATATYSTTTAKPATTTKPSTSVKSTSYVTGTIKKGTSLYLAEISPDDSYYTDRFEKVGQKGKVGTADLTEKEDGYYSGDFIYEDGSTAYFYKARFSKNPVDKLNDSGTETKKSTTTTATTKTDDDADYWGLFGMFGDGTSTSTSDSKSDDWDSATNDLNIKIGDKVEITAISPEDSYYDDRADYIGKIGVTQQDFSYVEEDNGYSGGIKLDNGKTTYFYAVKLKKSNGSSSAKSSSSSSRSSSSNSNLPSSIAKNTKVQVTDIGTEDSYYTSKEKYIGKKGKVADGLNLQTGGYYSGSVLFDDGTDGYFFNAKISILK